jgi:hypothetical protein
MNEYRASDVTLWDKKGENRELKQKTVEIDLTPFGDLALEKAILRRHIVSFPLFLETDEDLSPIY